MDDASDLKDPSDEHIRERVEKALDLTRDFLTPEEVEEHRRMLMFLARTHPALSTWLADQRPRTVPDESGSTAKPGAAALMAAMSRRKPGKAGGT